MTEIETASTDLFGDDGLTLRDMLVFEMLVRLRDRRVAFALDHHRNTRGEKMDLTGFPHVTALYESMSLCIVLQGSVQSMKSEFAIVDHFAAAYCGLSVFFVVPKYEARTTYVQNRVDKCVQQVPEYKRIIGESFFDNVTMKNFGKGVVKYVGSNVLADFKEFPADMIVVEEVDECDADNVEYALDRLRASRYQFRRYLGNPKLTGRGINKYFQQSDQREWEVPCFDCGEYSEMDWFKSIVEEVRDKEGNVIDYILRDKEWAEGCRRDINIICPRCGGVLDRVSMDGRWVPKFPAKAIEGYHISIMCSPINSISGMWVKFREAITDPLRMQQFYNSYLGLPFSAVGNKVTEALLLKCVEHEFAFTIGDGEAYINEDGHAGPCAMGVDVGGNFDVQIYFPEGRRRRLLFAGKVKHLDDLYDLVQRYSVEKCVMDSMPEVMMAQDFQEGCRGLMCDTWLCRYGSEGSDRRVNYDPMNRLLTTDRTAALDRSFAQMRGKRVTLPENFASILGGEYVAEMCGPVRQITEDAKGNQRYEWSKCKDHQRHADVYGMLAANLLEEAVLSDIAVG